MALELNLRNIAKAHTWAEEHFGEPMPGGSQTRMGRTYIRKREIQVSYNQHENHSADFYCVPDRIRGVYNENGFLHFAISEEQTFEGFSFQYRRLKDIRTRKTLIWHFANKPPLFFDKMLEKGAESYVSEESQEQLLLLFGKSVCYEVLKIYYEGFITRLFAVPERDALQRDIGSDKSQLTEKKSIIDFSEMSWGKVQLAWNKWCLKGKDYEGQSFERDGGRIFGARFPNAEVISNS